METAAADDVDTAAGLPAARHRHSGHDHLFRDAGFADALEASRQRPSAASGPGPNSRRWVRSDKALRQVDHTDGQASGRVATSQHRVFKPGPGEEEASIGQASGAPAHREEETVTLKPGRISSRCVCRRRPGPAPAARRSTACCEATARWGGPPALAARRMPAEWRSPREQCVVGCRGQQPRALPAECERRAARNAGERPAAGAASADGSTSGRLPLRLRRAAASRMAAAWRSRRSLSPWHRAAGADVDASGLAAASLSLAQMAGPRRAAAGGAAACRRSLPHREPITTKGAPSRR